MITVNIANNKLIPSRVFKTKPNRIKTVHYKGLYYEQVKQKGFYPLEFFIAQIPQLSSDYEMAFVKTSSNNQWMGCFINSIRKSIVIDNDVFQEQLRRYYFITSGKIAVINETFDTDIEELEFISVKNMPELIEPDKQRKQIINNLAVAALSFVVYTSIGLFSSSLSQEQISIQKQINDNATKLYELKKKKQETSFPSEQEQGKHLNQLIERFNNAQNIK